MNFSDLKYRLGILLVVIAILASLGISSPKPTEMASLPQIGDLAPPPATASVAPPPVPSAPESKAKNESPLNGNATWYGKVLHGRRTASGERFDMYRFTAAHKTLPFGTMLRVTNRQNGKWVVVKITDRGKLRPGRVIDLSYAAAKQLGIVTPGVVPVRLEKVGPNSPVSGQSQPVLQAKAQPVGK